MSIISTRIAAISLLLATTLFVSGAVPEWWIERGVSDANYDHFSSSAKEDAYSLLNIGQLKNMALKAKAELDAKIDGGAGAQIDLLVSGFTSYADSGNPEENYEAANLGQLKAVAKLFFDRIYESGGSVNLNGIVLYGDTKYPWPPAPVGDAAALEAWHDEQFEVANVGQLKYLFSWYVDGGGTPPPLPGGSDGDGNGIPDWWETYYFGSTLGSGANSDFTGEGKSVLQHYRDGTDPTVNPSVALTVFTPLEK